MPTARSPSTCWTASVTIPAGFVKLISHAPGARSAIASASATITGIVRSAKQMPARPGRLLPEHAERRAGRSSSTTRPSSWPTRIAQNTKSGALDRVVEVGRARGTAAAPPCSAASPSSTAPIRSSRVGVDVVQHDLLEPEPLRLAEQRAVDQRHAEPAAADDRELHATVTSTPAARRAERAAAGRRR